MEDISILISGAIMMGFFTVCLFFTRFWKKTSDIFFLLFAISFFIMGLERAILAIYYQSELRPLMYILRLLGFVMIIFAVLYKNLPDAGKKDN
jgi:hypothetical protein